MEDILADEDIAAGVTAVMQTAAPATVTEPCTRDDLLKPPDWRYQQACLYLAEQRSGRLPTAPSDPVVQYLVRGLRGMSGSMQDAARPFSRDRLFRPSADRYMQKCWPVLYEVLAYGMLKRRSAVAAMLDTCLMKGWSHAEAVLAGCPVNEAVYDLYAKAFFDLSGVRTVHCWIQDYLFEPERHAGTKDLLRARLLAYYGGGTSGVNAAVTGMADSTETGLMSRIVTTERQKKLFDYVAGKASLPEDVYAGIMEAALKSMSEHDFQERMRDREDAGSSSLEELAEHMEEGIRAFSRSELDMCDGSGLDFVNQYTRTLTGNDNGKKDIVR